MAYENDIEFKFQCPQIKLYWSRARFVTDALSVAALAQQRQR